mmetsp:Transcript_87334/g.260574  ORF Transcript_87334/g.260574 Transcript_87334/m.260574 type:complete len:90 (+) Transcript_87334:117-386(+)
MRVPAAVLAAWCLVMCVLADQQAEVAAGGPKDDEDSGSPSIAMYVLGALGLLCCCGLCCCLFCSGGAAFLGMKAVRGGSEEQQELQPAN